MDPEGHSEQSRLVVSQADDGKHVLAPSSGNPTAPWWLQKRTWLGFWFSCFVVLAVVLACAVQSMNNMVASNQAVSSTLSLLSASVAPQGQAASSLPFMRFCSPFDDPAECAALVDLATTFNYSYWTLDWPVMGGAWLTTQSYCTWKGVTCGGPGMKVIALDMNFNLMSGPVPTSVGNTAFHYGAVIPMSLQNLKSLAKFSIGIGGSPVRVWGLGFHLLRKGRKESAVPTSV